jgi:iron complex outermembrane receptor protein
LKRHPDPAARRARPLVLLPAAAALAACMGAAAQAQPAASGEPATILPAVQVTGTGETATSPVEGYVATRSATATKTDTPLSETPQAITVIPREQIVDQGAQNIQDTMNYAAGVRPNAYGVDNRADYVRVRGVEPVQYLDGLRQYFSFNNPRTEVYAMERVEVLRGPASMLYGQGSTGGIVNLVSKRPQEETQREIGVVLGNHNRREIQADLTGSASEDGQWLYRVIAVGRDSDTQVQYAPDDRLMLAPSLTWRPSAATSLTLQATWQKDRAGTTQSFLPWSGSVQENPNGRIPTRRFASEPGFDAYDTEQFSVGWLFEHQFNDTWKVRQNFRNTVSSVDYKTLYPNVYGARRGDSYIDPEQTTVDRIFYVNKPRMRTLLADQNVEGKLNWGRTEHTVIFGMDYSRYRETSQTASGAGSPLNLYHPVYGNVPEYELSDNPKINQQQIGFYAQDQIKFDKNWPTAPPKARTGKPTWPPPSVSASCMPLTTAGRPTSATANRSRPSPAPTSTTSAGSPCAANRWRLASSTCRRTPTSNSPRPPMTCARRIARPTTRTIPTTRSRPARPVPAAWSWNCAAASPRNWT